MNERVKTYNSCSKALAQLNDQEIIKLLADAKPFHSSMWSASSLLNLNGTNVFVKKIPLTDLERLPENFQSTVNLFNLPPYYQYGVGSAGSGAWRELASHLMTTNWVLMGECLNFPILYHWRAVPCNKPEPMDEEQSDRLVRDVAYWEGSDAVRERLVASHNASAHIVLFLEYIPRNLYQWFSTELTSGVNVEQAIDMVDNALKATTDFMRAHDFIHFDAHFENILTDGRQLYFSDFGLSLSKEFDLSAEEITFFEDHHMYDRCSTIVNLLHCLATCQFGKDKWKIWLQECLDKEREGVIPAIASTVKKYAAAAIIMDEFYQSLIKKSKLTPYPKEELEHLLKKIDY